jgi:hypothetical protein
MPNQIFIPFQSEFKEPMLSGKKTATTRPTRYGYPGDWFPAFGKFWVLTLVYPTFLDIVVSDHYQDEGFDSSADFIRCWDRLHPHITYQLRPSRRVFFHRFAPKDKNSRVLAPSPVPALSQKQEAKHV